MASKLTFIKMDVDKSTGDVSPTGMFTSVPFNPDSLTYNRKTQMVSVDGSDNAGSTTQVKGKAPDTISFDLYFDGTGAIPGSGDVNVEILKLYTCLFDLQGEIHSPNVNRIVWGLNFDASTFEGTVDTFNTTYSLFKPDGTPLRAKVSLSFTQYTKQEQNDHKGEMSSPDLTHAQTVKDGDHLTLKCHDIYNDVGHYINVAKYNGLVNFRKLELGSNIFMPPLN